MRPLNSEDNRSQDNSPVQPTGANATQGTSSGEDGSRTTASGSAAVHKCDACGGSGARDCAKYMPSNTDRSGRAARMRVALGHERRKNPCPVCLGAGVISDRMPASDALADAETLLTVLTPPWSNIEWQTQSDAEEAESIGLGYDFTKLWPDVARFEGRRAARAAFRAVPALRGE